MSLQNEVLLGPADGEEGNFGLQELTARIPNDTAVVDTAENEPDVEVWSNSDLSSKKRNAARS